MGTARPRDGVLLIGVDACPAGWVGVALRDGAFDRAVAAACLTDLLAQVPGVRLAAVDIPIGLLERGWRRADLEARRRLGRQGISVFPTPPRAVVEAPDYGEAQRRCRALTGQGLSPLAWRLTPRILDADRCLGVAGAPALYEVHPEVSFQALAGGPLPGKRSWDGQLARRALLRRHGIALPRQPGGLGAAGRLARADDVLDAAVAAWSGTRIAAGTAGCLPDPPELDPHGRAVAIWY
jgi:predicted RNase H-like nuclease